MAFIAPPPPGVRVPMSPGLETSLRRAMGPLRRQPAVPVALALVAVLVVVHGQAAQALLAGGAYLLATLGGAVLAVVGARRADASSRAGWHWIAGGLVVSAVADVIWTMLSAREGGVLDLAVADLLWLLGYVALGVGLFLIAAPGRSPAGTLLALGMLSRLVADVVHMALAGTPAWNPWYASGWMVGAVVVGIAAFTWRPDRSRPERPRTGLG